MESSTDFDFERQIHEKFLFRATTGGSWYENRNGFYYHFNLALFQPINFTRALQYELRNSFETRPNNYLSETVISTRYRQTIWRDWLFFEVEPQIKFPRTRNYGATPGIRLALEITFARDGLPSD